MERERVRELLLLEDLQRLRPDRSALQRRIKLGCGPGHPLGHICKIRGPLDHLGFEFHVAAHIGLGRLHDGDVAGLLHGFLQAFERLPAPGALGG